LTQIVSGSGESVWSRGRSSCCLIFLARVNTLSNNLLNSVLLARNKSDKKFEDIFH
jgi:hypothetical protein